MHFELNVNVKYKNLDVEKIMDGLDHVIKKSDHMDIKMKLEVTEKEEVPLPGHYFIKVECKSNKNEAILQTNRIAKLSFTDCSGSRVEVGIVSLLSSIFAPEFKMLKEKYLPMKEQNVYIILTISRKRGL